MSTFAPHPKLTIARTTYMKLHTHALHDSVRAGPNICTLPSNGYLLTDFDHTHHTPSDGDEA
jgi:hypothetical protein